ncbi:MAG: acyl carrier protein [Firmicutes bacterium]|nr:acyl carrier protein [Bacillota bacterium]
MKAEQIRQKLCAVLEKVNKQMPQADNMPFDMDSLALMMFIYEVENAFNIKFGLNDFDTEITPERLVFLIAAKQL